MEDTTYKPQALEHLHCAGCFLVIPLPWEQGVQCQPGWQRLAMGDTVETLSFRENLLPVLGKPKPAKAKVDMLSHNKMCCINLEKTVAFESHMCPNLY